MKIIYSFRRIASDLLNVLLERDALVFEINLLLIDQKTVLHRIEDRHRKRKTDIQPIVDMDLGKVRVRTGASDAGRRIEPWQESRACNIDLVALCGDRLLLRKNIWTVMKCCIDRRKWQRSIRALSGNRRIDPA